MFGAGRFRVSWILIPCRPLHLQLQLQLQLPVTMKVGNQPAWTFCSSPVSLSWVLEPFEPGLHPLLGRHIVNPTTANKLRRYLSLRVRFRARSKHLPFYGSDWRVPFAFSYFRVLPSQLSPFQLPPSPPPLAASSSAFGHFTSTHEPPRISISFAGNICSVQHRKTSLCDQKMSKLLTSLFELRNGFIASLGIVVNGDTASQPMLKTRQSSANSGICSAVLKAIQVSPSPDLISKQMLCLLCPFIATS